MASEPKRAMDLARLQYDKAISKLETNTEKKKKDKIPPAIQQVEKAWEKLDEAKDEYLLELRSAGGGDEASRITKEYAKLESDKEDRIEEGEAILKKARFQTKA
eukprot:TRINITY_DN7628_c0_g1_i1.p1 TRINITY_DN7628_c0_g1~~TRINITY_DN7628_c0_g1_i1.p1  ORF type:complete len:122 (+),score=38.77 TRINITY_DN7628_c0_g1_i1:56-367(+)